MATGRLLEAALILAASGVPGLLLPRGSPWGARLSTFLVLVGAALGGTAVLEVLSGRPGVDLPFPWPALGDSVVGVDALSAFFLVPVLLVGALGSVYSLGYWPARRYPRSARRMRVFWGTLAAGMTILVVSRHAMAFLLGWEVMALSAFFLVGTEDSRAEVRWAAWIYLVATHVGTLSLFALFALWKRVTGSYDLLPLPEGAASLSALHALFLLALVGFGTKAGVMPLHFWLPTAHANAPSHVSAILSGVVLKMGIYGLVRFLSLLPAPPPIWGATLLVLGLASGMLGIVFALAQRDLKRLLAYSSVENVGIILMGLGLAMLGRSCGEPAWVALGLGGALLHVWNHSLFKALLFYCAGAVVHAAKTREIDRLGGLARSMPWTASLFVVGAIAVCGLPPANGFVSELLLYLGFLGTMASPGLRSSAVLAAPALATIGALAVACFVKALGAVFLGSPRDPGAHAHEAPLSMRAPAVVLAGCCLVLGVAPILFRGALDRATAGWGAPGLAEFVPLATVSAVQVGVAGALLVLGVASFRLVPATRRSVTWDCGYAQPAARIQYSGSSFTDSAARLFDWALRRKVEWPRVEGLFPARTAFRTEVSDPVLDRLLVPASRLAVRGTGWIRRFQQGLTHRYVLYVLIALVALLGTLVPVDGFLARLFTR